MYTVAHCSTHCNTHCNILQPLYTYMCIHLSFSGEYSPSHNSLQHNATPCNTQQHTALQHTATYCNTLQHTATPRNTQQHTANPIHLYVYTSLLYQANALHLTAHCNTLQHNATHCNILQPLYTYMYIHLSFTERIFQSLSLSLSLSFIIFPPPCLYGVAPISMMLKNICLFCKRALQKRPVFCKETCIFKHPTHRSHPISLVLCLSLSIFLLVPLAPCLSFYLYLSFDLHLSLEQHTATHCITLQHTATHCNILQHTATY